MTDLVVDLDRLLELLEHASEAPWQWLDSGNEPGQYDELQDGHGEMVASGFRDDINLDGPPPGQMTDGRLCAELRNAAPELIRRLRAAEAGTPAGPEERGEGLPPLKWWVLADIAHARNESIADVGGHCNHDESPPECIREGQTTAREYNAVIGSDTGAEERLRAALVREIVAYYRLYDHQEVWNERGAMALVDWLMARRVISTALHDSASSGTREEGT